MQGVKDEIVGQIVILRPYLRQFVEKYHSWMVCSSSLFTYAPFGVSIHLKSLYKDEHAQEDPILRELTASEPLTLEVGSR